MVCTCMSTPLQGSFDAPLGGPARTSPAARLGTPSTTRSEESKPPSAPLWRWPRGCAVIPRTGFGLHVPLLSNRAAVGRQRHAYTHRELGAKIELPAECPAVHEVPLPHQQAGSWTQTSQPTSSAIWPKMAPWPWVRPVSRLYAMMPHR